MSYPNIPQISEFVNAYTIDQSKLIPKCSCKNQTPAIKFPQTKFKPDNKLINWKDWMAERRKIQKKLKEALNRGEILMNSFEHIRSVREEKIVLEYTKILKPDRYRGCPKFFSVPESLRNKCDPKQGTPYFLQETKEQKCQIPEIEYVSVPFAIRSEKGVFKEISTGSNWIRSEYRREVVREKRETFELQRVQPFKPAGEEIVIIGHMPRPTRKPHKYSVQSLTFHPQQIFNEPIIELTTQNVIALNVDEFKLRPTDVTIRKMIISFQYDICKNKAATKYMQLRNKGTVVLRFQLQRVKIPCIFRDIIPETKPSVCFSFNKNEEIILPGQKIDFPFYFMTNTHGKHSETWMLVTNPPVLHPESKFYIVLNAYSEFGNIFQKVEKINEMLITRVIAERTANLVEMENGKETGSGRELLYSKTHVFEAINSNFDPMNKNPQYLYNHEAVLAMEELYSKIKRPDDPEEWDMHVGDLKKLAKQFEDVEYHEKHEGLKQLELTPQLQEHDYSAATKSSKSASKSKGKSAKSSEKHSKMSSVAKVQGIIPTKKTPTRELEEILERCKPPFVRPNTQQKKHQLAYKIFCVHFDKIGDSIETLKEDLNFKQTQDTYPKMVVNKSICPPTRLTMENSDDFENYKPMYDRLDLLKESLKATDCLKDIPKDNVDERLKLYRQIVLGIIPEDNADAGVKKKGKGKGKDKKAKSKSPEKKGKGKEKEKKKKGKGKEGAGAKEKEHKKEDFSCPSFDPHAYVNFDESLTSTGQGLQEGSSSESVQDRKRDPIQSHYEYNLYMIINSGLKNAVMEMVDMLETFQAQTLTRPLIKAVDDSIRLNDVHNVADLKRAIEENKLKYVLSQRESKIKNVIIQKEPSETSIWSILDTYREKKRTYNLTDTTPISYPTINNRELRKTDAATMFAIQTETDGGIVSETWQKGWPIGIQKDAPEGDPEIDLEEDVEVFGWRSSVQKLIGSDDDNDNEDESVDDETISEEKFYL